ncbi:MAG: class I SAM-dependent methyltransferase [Thermoplasmata archaeon]|nr:MAG: class I SAM-dependent methyltransferase [Thermoplasmata archaeon]
MAKKSKSFHDLALRTLEKILSTNFFGRLYTKFFEKMTLDEFEMVEIKKGNKVLHVGCGAVPNTLLILAGNMEAHFVGIDRDKKAVEKARGMVKKYELDKKIKIEKGDAMTYPLSNFDVIIISLGVEPREKKRYLRELEMKPEMMQKLLQENPGISWIKFTGKKSSYPMVSKSWGHSIDRIL